MKACFLSPSGFSVKEIDKPVCGDNDVLVKTSACGVCEGDVFQYKTRANKPPQGEIIGHEGSGVVAETGKNVKGFKTGDKVTALYGTYSEYFLIKPELLLRLPENVSALDALGEPVACFMHAANRFGVKKGGKVALIGCGYMGLGCLQMVKIQGAKEIIVLEPIEWRRKAAIDAGATKTYDPSGKSAAQILAELGECDVVIEATGVAPVIDICTKLVRQHGKIILVGYHQSEGGMRTVDMKTWNFKAIDVINGHVRREDEKREAMKKGMQLLSEGRLDFKKAVAFYKFEDIEKAFADLLNRKEGLFKAVLTF
jgi:threonine dehydrogenase-like Zn-dependent dehydrogenase